MFGFTIPTLDKHINDCLKTSYLQLLHQTKIENYQDADSRFQLLVKRGEEAIESAAESLRVNGEINLNPRSWEVNVVYEHPFLKDFNDKPLVLTDTLENVLNLLRDNKIHVKKSILKMEDIRKTYREERKNQAELIDKYFRIFGAYKLDESQQKTHDQLETIRATIEHASLKLNSTYHIELAKFIEIYGKKIRPELLKILQSEELSLRPTLHTPPIPKKGLLNRPALSAPLDKEKKE
jgi:hypothetical protein